MTGPFEEAALPAGDAFGFRSTGSIPGSREQYSSVLLKPKASPAASRRFATPGGSESLRMVAVMAIL